MPTKNHFAVLGIDIGAGEDAIKKAYRTLAKKWHPDKNKDEGAKEKFQEIAASYEYLSSQDRREMLERELRKATVPPPTRPNPFSTQQQQHQNNYNNFSTYHNAGKSSQKEPSSTKSSSSSTTSSKPRMGSAKSKPKSHWSESFTRSYRSQHQKANNSTGGKSSQTNSTREPPFDFRSFASTPSDENDMFEELFGDFYNAMGFSGLSGRVSPGVHHSNKPKATRPRNVAPETGNAEGLDEEYIFTPRRGNEDSAEKLPCPWCGQLFTRGKLSQHEEKCGKFGLSAEEDEDDDEEDDGDGFDSDDLDGFSFYSNSSSIRQQTYSRRPSWQQKHEETRNKIRRDKMRYRDRVASQGTRNSGYITCPYCLRDFSTEASVKHMPWCKEHTARFGQPLNPKPKMASKRTEPGRREDESKPRPTGAYKTSGYSYSGATTATKRGEAGSQEFPGQFFRQGRFVQKEDIPPRTGNDQPFPTHGPKIPDMFGVNRTQAGEPRRPSRSPNITISVGRGPKIFVGLSTSSQSNKTRNPNSPSAHFTAQASRRQNGAFNVKFNLNANVGQKSPRSYANGSYNRR